MHYRLVRPRDPVTASILATVLDSIRRDPKLQTDRERLTRACCQPNRFVTLQRAPQPTVL
jgi:ArsR family transcriptional regulator